MAGWGRVGHQLITHSSPSSRQQCKRKLSNFIVVSLIAPSGTIQSSHLNYNGILFVKEKVTLLNQCVFVYNILFLDILIKQVELITTVCSIHCKT